MFCVAVLCVAHRPTREGLISCSPPLQYLSRLMTNTAADQANMDADIQHMVHECDNFTRDENLEDFETGRRSKGLICFGRGREGALGLGGSEEQRANLFFPHLNPTIGEQSIIDMENADGHSIALTAAKEVLVWGLGDMGRLGLGKPEQKDLDDEKKRAQSVNRFVPTSVPHPRGLRVEQVSANGEHSAFIDEEGKLYTFGWGNCGRLGHGDELDRWKPTLVANSFDGKRVLDVCCGVAHTAVLADDQSVWVFGKGEYGRLGDGNMDTHKVLKPEKLKLKGFKVLNPCGGASVGPLRGRLDAVVVDEEMQRGDAGGRDRCNGCRAACIIWRCWLTMRSCTCAGATTTGSSGVEIRYKCNRAAVFWRSLMLVRRRTSCASDCTAAGHGRCRTRSQSRSYGRKGPRRRTRRTGWSRW